MSGGSAATGPTNRAIGTGQPAPAVEEEEAACIGLIVLKVASACNLDCSYCYVYHGKDRGFAERPATLGDSVLAALLGRIRDYCSARPGHRMAICLHGGEPLLLGKSRFEHLVTSIRSGLGEHLGSLSVQTNGVLVDREWAELLARLKMSVSLSLDGSPGDHDRVRLDHKNRGTHARAVQGLRHLRAAGIRVSVLCVATPGGDGAAAYRYFRSEGLTSFDFLLPDISHDDWLARFGASGATPVADYLLPILEEWLSADDASIDIRFFSDIFRMILGGGPHTDAFGGGPSSYLLVETDGSIEANDALRVCGPDVGKTGLNVLDHSLDALEDARPLAREILLRGLPLPSSCLGCREARTCAGGYLPHRYSDGRGFDNPSVWCADIVKLFSRMRHFVDTSATGVAA